jgi:hypothetical protein
MLPRDPSSQYVRVKLGDETKTVIELLGFSADIYARPPPL